MRRPRQIRNIIDVERIDSHQQRTALLQGFCGSACYIWMPAARVLVGSPMLIPTGVKQNRSTSNINSLQQVFI